MTRLLERLSAYAEFECVLFGNDCLLQLPAAEWPVVDALIAFYSDGFPLQKAMEYVQLRQPFCINDVPAQWV
jgi:inositol hexakisphosphate/diphosphoinositol-pentakisphosphate kinase